MDKKVEIEFDIEDTLYDKLVERATQKNISVDELFERFVKEGLERDKNVGIKR